MAYEKRLCVLKQVKKGFSADGGSLSGVIYAERVGTTLTVTPRIIGIAPVKEGRFALAVWVDGKTFCLELNGNEPLKLQNAPSLRRGFAALVCFVRGEAEPVAYGMFGEAPASYSVLLSAVEGERKSPIPTPLPPNEVPFPTLPNTPRAPGVPLPGPIPEEETPQGEPFRRQGKYDDDAIAASNYYRKEQDDEDENAARLHEGEGEKVAGGRHSAVHEAPLLPRGSLTYYNTVRERLEEAMKKFPPDESLKGAFPLSEWVKAESGVLLGIVYESGSPRYLCVAVEKNGDPPEEMKENCAFVPTTVFSDDEGFWVVFQDADTGEYVKVYDN